MSAATVYYSFSSLANFRALFKPEDTAAKKLGYLAE